MIDIWVSMVTKKYSGLAYWCQKSVLLIDKTMW